MKRSIVETVLGAVVLAAALVFLVFSYSTANVGSVSGYNLTANFSGTGGLAVGDDVTISGVKIGSVSRVDLDPASYLARVTITVDPTVRLPDDTAALISSESLMGGKYMALEPGASEDMLSPGGHIQYTQAPQNLEQLLGQFIFSMQKDDKAGKGEKTAAAEPAPAPAPTPAPVVKTPDPAPAQEPEAAPETQQAPAPKFAPAAPMQVPVPDAASDEPADE